jgi:hypothetical protein
VCSPVKKSKPLGCLVRKYSEIASWELTIGSPPVWPKSYERNSVPLNVASLGALSVVVRVWGKRNMRYQNIYSHPFSASLLSKRVVESGKEKGKSRRFVKIERRGGRGGEKIEFIMIFAAAANHIISSPPPLLSFFFIYFSRSSRVIDPREEERAAVEREKACADVKSFANNLRLYISRSGLQLKLSSRLSLPLTSHPPHSSVCL